MSEYSPYNPHPEGHLLRDVGEYQVQRFIPDHKFEEKANIERIKYHLKHEISKAVEMKCKPCSGCKSVRIEEYEQADHIRNRLHIAVKARCGTPSTCTPAKVPESEEIKYMSDHGMDDKFYQTYMMSPSSPKFDPSRRFTDIETPKNLDVPDCQDGDELVW